MKASCSPAFFVLLSFLSLATHAMHLSTQYNGRVQQIVNIQHPPHDAQSGLVLFAVGAAWCLHESCYFDPDECTARENATPVYYLARLAAPFSIALYGAYLLGCATYDHIEKLVKQ